MKPTVALLPVMLAAAFLLGQATRADDEDAATVPATYYKIRITTEFSHDWGHWAHEVFLPEQKVCLGLDFDREDVLDEDNCFVRFDYTPRARAWHAERPRTDFPDARGRRALGVTDIQIPAALADSIKDFADLTERWRAEGYRVGEEVATGLALDPNVLPVHEGHVLSVDADTGIVTISLGADDGVLPTLRYRVTRGDELIGAIRIAEVQPRQASGRSIEGLQRGEIRRGDQVATP